MGHPTGKTPEKVILVGLGPSKSEYMDITASDSLIINRDEVWGINGAGAVVNVDLSFAMDDYLTCVNRTPAFAKFFEETDKPLFTSQPRTPTALAYPLQEVLNMPGARPYFNGSVSYVAAYASMIGVKELTIFGCDYLYGGMGRMHPRQSETVARYLACMAFWLGFCQARGMKVVVCPSSPLLDADLNVLEQFYGYIVKPIVNDSPSLPPHLGGSFGRCHTDEGALRYMVENYGVSSLLDIGCGTGGMLEVAHQAGLEVAGIDGDFTAKRNAPVLVHDFTAGPAEFENTFDLAWSVEFLEHVEEQYMDNYMAAFQRCKYALVTFAPEGTPGHHHVNCRDEGYWVNKFADYGFALDEEGTAGVRAASTMGRDFMRDNGLLLRSVRDGV
jgi:SAM-dependent methyltransferase